jgi:hypothetical protein
MSIDNTLVREESVILTGKSGPGRASIRRDVDIISGIGSDSDLNENSVVKQNMLEGISFTKILGVAVPEVPEVGSKVTKEIPMISLLYPLLSLGLLWIEARSVLSLSQRTYQNHSLWPIVSNRWETRNLTPSRSIICTLPQTISTSRSKKERTAEIRVDGKPLPHPTSRHVTSYFERKRIDGPSRPLIRRR